MNSHFGFNSTSSQVELQGWKHSTNHPPLETTTPKASQGDRDP